MKKYEKAVENRKVLVTRLTELTGAEAVYTRVPRCAYEVGGFTVEKDGSLTVEDEADETIIAALTAEGLIGEAIEEAVIDTSTAENPIEEEATEETAPENTETEPLSFPLDAQISFPLAQHTAATLTNLINMIYSRGALLSKATSGEFRVSKSLVDDLADCRFIRAQDVSAFMKDRDESDFAGLAFDEEKVTFTGFQAVPDAEHFQTFMKLAAAMHKMAITQKRVQAKKVDDSNEKYAFRIWLLRLGMTGEEYSADRKRLLENLTGHTAFRDEGERERWTARQKERRDALKAKKEDDVQ